MWFIYTNSCVFVEEIQVDRKEGSNFQEIPHNHVSNQRLLHKGLWTKSTDMYIPSEIQCINRTKYCMKSMAPISSSQPNSFRYFRNLPVSPPAILEHHLGTNLHCFKYPATKSKRVPWLEVGVLCAASAPERTNHSMMSKYLVVAVLLSQVAWDHWLAHECYQFSCEGHWGPFWGVQMPAQSPAIDWFWKRKKIIPLESSGVSGWNDSNFTYDWSCDPNSHKEINNSSKFKNQYFQSEHAKSQVHLKHIGRKVQYSPRLIIEICMGNFLPTGSRQWQTVSTTFSLWEQGLYPVQYSNYHVNINIYIYELLWVRNKTLYPIPFYCLDMVG